ncbi:MAG: hypothetical protein ABS980_32555 [Rhodococcus sp. (in: high G+C Gram-positive bacteria)]|jgi:hypothetical protein
MTFGRSSRRNHRGTSEQGGRWAFEHVVETVGGEEGVWLRTELSKVLASLVHWAYQDQRSIDSPDDEIAGTK